jgi:hypothetical protein
MEPMGLLQIARVDAVYSLTQGGEGEKLAGSGKHEECDQ